MNHLELSMLSYYVLYLKFLKNHAANREGSFNSDMPFITDGANYPY